MGWNGSGQKGAAPAQPKVTTKKPSPIRGLIAGGAAVVVLAVVAYFVFFSSSEKPQAEKSDKDRGRIKEVTPAAAPVYKEEAPDTNAVAAARNATREKLKKMTPDERWEYFVEQAKKTPLDLTPRSNMLYRTSTEQSMAVLFSKRLGDSPPKLPSIPLREQAHFAEILIADNPILPTDTEAQKAIKEQISLVKNELKNYIREGGDVEGFFSYYQGQLEQAHGEWMDAQKSFFKVAKEDPEIAGEYLSQVNERLTKKGIKPLLVPPQMKEKLGLAD